MPVEWIPTIVSSVLSAMTAPIFQDRFQSVWRGKLSKPLGKGKVDLAALDEDVRATLVGGPLEGDLRQALETACKGFTESALSSWFSWHPPRREAALKDLMENASFVGALARLAYGPWRSIDVQAPRELFEKLGPAESDGEDFDTAWRLLGRRFDHAVADSDRLSRLRALSAEALREKREEAHLTTAEQQLAVLERLEALVREVADGAQAAAERASPGARAEALEEGKVTRDHSRYLQSLRRYCRALPLAALEAENDSDRAVTLREVFIELDTTTQVPKEEASEVAEGIPRAVLEGRPGEELPPLSAMEAALSRRQLVLLGDPGSGKSSFVKEFLARAADRGLGEAEGDEAVTDNPADEPLPVFIVLRDLAERLAGLDLEGLSGERREEALAAAVAEQARADAERRLEAAAFAPRVAQAVSAGTCLLVCDGLDEVASGLAKRVRDAVLAATRRYRPARILVTCRVRSWSEGWLPGFPAHQLASLNPDKVRSFTAAWYGAREDLGAEQARKLAEELGGAALEEGLSELSSNPMLLTLMALIHQKEACLPRERAKLYDLSVEILLRRWQRYKVGEALAPSPELCAVLEKTELLRRVLEELAYAVHQREAEAARGPSSSGGGSSGSGTLKWGEAVELLRGPGQLGSASLAEAFLDYVDRRAGLLVGQGGLPEQPSEYAFPHRTFQEYLAGGHLVQRRSPWRELRERAREGHFWAEAAQLGAEDLLYVRRNPTGLLDLLYHLGGGLKPAWKRRLVLWTGRMAALAGRARIEGDEEPAKRRAFLRTLERRLVRLLGEEGLPAQERAQAGRALARLEDPRPEALRVDAMEFLPVPSGDFHWGGFGSGKTEVRSLPREYWIGRFPVTQGQYGEFVASGGYREARYWAEAAEVGVWSDGTIQDRDSPERYSERFDLANHPVVGVSWYEALAFTRWLNDRLRAAGRLPAGLEVRLPLESEWEKAARGGLELPSAEAAPVALSRVREAAVGEGTSRVNPVPQRPYPWGEKKPTQELANYSATKLSCTSAVGCFPKGRGPYGCEEMAGNVWEWCMNYEGDTNDRGLRGGSWINPARYLALAFRSRFRPSFRSRDIGFRCVLSVPPEP